MEESGRLAAGRFGVFMLSTFSVDKDKVSALRVGCNQHPIVDEMLHLAFSRATLQTSSRLPIRARHNVCQLKKETKKTHLLANVDYTAGINPTAQSHNQGGGS
jgi:hypothetical protein